MTTSHDAAAAWDDHADTYAKLFAPLTGFVARSMWRMVEPRLPPTPSLLDIACGSGALALPAVERLLEERRANGSAGTIVATDFSPKMVALTQANAAALGAGDDVIRCAVENGEALSFADASFDAAFSSFGIFLFGDRRAGWREAARVLRPGGTFATSVWQGPQNNPMLRAQIVPIMESLPKHLLPTQKGGWMEISDASALIAEVTDSAPFTDVRCHPFHATIVIPDWRAAWDSMRNNPVMGALLRACTEAELAVVKDHVLGQFRGLAGGDGQPLLLESVCNILVATRR